MQKIWDWFKTLLKEEPAVVAWAINGGLAGVLAYVFHFSQTQEAACATIVTAAAAVYTAWRARPVNTSIIVGALVTALTAAGAFGLHLAPEVLAAAQMLISAVLALIFRANLSPRR